MSSEIISAVIALIGTAASGLISWFISRASAAKEIEKMKLEWSREDTISSDDDFSKMASAVSRYAQCGSIDSLNTAVEQTAGIRSKENGSLAVKLDSLYFELRTGRIERLDTLLTEVIEEKRNRKSRQNRPRA